MPHQQTASQDVDSPEAIDELVECFYARVLEDEVLAPVFIDVAEIDLDRHLPRIKAFWRKMLLGHPDYSDNMVARHVAVHARERFRPEHFERWLSLFRASVDEHFEGPGADRARLLAERIAANLEKRLDEFVTG